MSKYLTQLIIRASLLQAQMIKTLFKRQKGKAVPKHKYAALKASTGHTVFNHALPTNNYYLTLHSTLRFGYHIKFN
jgi:hypothetical protein